MSKRGKVQSVRWLLDKITNENSGDHRTRYFYRGEAVTGSKLTPRLLRDEEKLEKYMKLYSCTTGCIIELQHELLSRFRRYASSQNIADSFNSTTGESPTLDEWLCIAQHHGLPTLLLDWSLHPLIGLYFSVRDTTKHSEPGRFWYLKLQEKAERSGYTVRLRDKSGEKNGILLSEEPKIQYGLFGKRKSDKNEHSERPRIIEHPRIIVPWVFNKRIEAQHARFTYSGHLHIDKGLEEIEDDKRPWTTLEWFEVPPERKPIIKNELEKLQIHEKTLFPDMDGLSRYLEGGGI